MRVTKCRLLFVPLLRACAAAGFLRGASDDVALLQAHLETRQPATPEQRLEAAMALAQQRPEGHSQRQPMINFGDAQYVSYLQMGEQMVAGIIDTGSFELAVFGPECNSSNAAAQYKPHLSATYERGHLQMTNNDSSLATHFRESFENVSIGPFPSTRQMFWEVDDKADMPALQNSAFKAVIGVGPTEAMLLRVWNGVDTIIENLTKTYYDQAMMAPEEVVAQAEEMVQIAIRLGSELPLLHTWSVPAFSICLGARPGDDGVIVWNDTRAHALPGSFARVPVLPTHTWSVNMTRPALAFGKDGSFVELGCSSGCDALLDTGTSLLGAPSAAIRQLVEAMEGLDSECSNVGSLPTLIFQLGGQEFSLPPSAYMAKVEEEVPAYLREQMPHLQKSKRRRACELMLVDMGDTFPGAEMWILGVPFFRKYYTTFELGERVHDRKVHIAQHTDCEPESPRGDISMVQSQQALPHVDATRLQLPWRPRGLGSVSYRRQG